MTISNDLLEKLRHGIREQREWKRKAARDVGRGRRPQRMIKPIVYFAGRMAGCKKCDDWRDAIAGFAGLYDTGERFGDAKGRIDEDIVDCKSFFYGGPFVIEGTGGHTFGHTGFTEAHQMVWDIDKAQIERANLVFAYLEDAEAFGTLVEIGYAAALGKPVVIGFSDAMRREDYDELWLARMAVAKVYLGPPGEVWSQVHADWIGVPRTAREKPTGSFFTGGVGVGVNYTIPSFDFEDDARVGGDDMHLNYRWLDVAELCAAQRERIPAEHHGFLHGVSDRLADGQTISGRQAKYLGRLFHQFVLGKHVR